MGRGAGLAEMARIRCRWLTSSCTTEHALENGKTLVVGNDLFQPDGGNVQFRTTCAHVGIALVGTYHDIARLGNTEIGTRHTCIGSEELIAQRQSGAVRQVRGVVVALLVRDALFFKQLTHVVVVQMDGWHHDMTRCLPF